MNEMVHLVSQRIGVPEEKAREAVEVVVGYLKDRLPAPVAAGLNQFVGDTGNTQSQSSGVLDDLFGKKAS